MPIKCEFCGMEYETPPGKFCDRCGRAMSRAITEIEDDAPEYKKCGKCGHRNPVEQTVCLNCGERLHDRHM